MRDAVYLVGDDAAVVYVYIVPAAAGLIKPNDAVRGAAFERVPISRAVAQKLIPVADDLNRRVTLEVVPNDNQECRAGLHRYSCDCLSRVLAANIASTVDAL